MDQLIPAGYCQCGCGGETRIATVSNKHYGYVRGEPLRFLRGHQKQPSFSERFWTKVARREEGDCWEWQGSRASKLPYGLFRTSKDPAAHAEPAHRVAWRLTHGDIPLGIQVLHRCDNPPCVNPSHLFLGTPADNMADKVAKGRHRTPKGTKMPTAKLDDARVRTIRSRAESGEAQKNLAAEYGVSKQTISLIVRRLRWAHVD